jgi:hypothetical protein
MPDHCQQNVGTFDLVCRRSCRENWLRSLDLNRVLELMRLMCYLITLPRNSKINKNGGATGNRTPICGLQSHRLTVRQIAPESDGRAIRLDIYTLRCRRFLIVNDRFATPVQSSEIHIPEMLKKSIPFINFFSETLRLPIYPSGITLEFWKFGVVPTVIDLLHYRSLLGFAFSGELTAKMRWSFPTVFRAPTFEGLGTFGNAIEVVLDLLFY